jgi:hypothetical protein
VRISRRARLRAGQVAAAGLMGLALVAFAGAAVAKGPPHPGKGLGREKVTLCHKGHTITVGKPAVRAHLRHGDTLGPCQHPPAPPAAHPTLTVIKHVVNDDGGTKAAADFTLTINGVTAVGGNTLAGSESGVTKTLATLGGYSVTEGAVAGYAATFSAGCFGMIAADDHKTCTVTNDDIPAKLTVIKHVVNNNGGTKTAADFTLTINGVNAIGGNTFAGSETGTTRSLAAVGAYNVTEVALLGYHLTSASADCTGTIALGEQKTCVLTNDDNAPS